MSGLRRSAQSAVYRLLRPFLAFQTERTRELPRVRARGGKGAVIVFLLGKSSPDAPPEWASERKSLNQVVTLKAENQVLIVIKLNTEDKIIKFNDWVKTKLKGENDLQATEEEIVRAAVKIDKASVLRY